MKKIFQFAAVAVLAIGLSSCVKDATETTGPDNQDRKGKLTFVLPLAQTGVTYARDLSASDAEKELILANTQIFMFDATSGELEVIIDGASVTEGVTGGKKTATIDIDENWTGGKKFYFVGNTATATSLPTDVSPVVTETAFLDLVTVSQGSTHLATPLLLTGFTSVGDIQNAASVNVSLYRSVARFDIDNNVVANNVTIEEIYVENANLQGYVMGYHRSGDGAATVEFASGVATGDLPAVAVKAADADDDTDADNQLHESAFYLYPTVLKADESATNIRLVAKINGGDSEIFIVKKYNGSNQPEDFAIEANRRYKISATADPAVEEGKVMFVLTAEDWDEGDEIIGTPTLSALELIGDVTGSALNSYVGNTIALNATNGNSVTFSLAASSSKGTSWSWDAASTGVTVTEVPSATTSYASPYFTSTYTITVEDLSESFFQTLTITDKANPNNTFAINVMYSAENPDAVVEINETTFPDESFRSYVEKTLKLRGMVTQSQLDGITSIILVDKGATDISGLEYFTNAKSINLPGNPITNLDVTKFTSLEVLKVRGINMKTLDLSKCKELTEFFAERSSLEELDFTNCHKIKRFSVYDSSNLRVLKFGSLDSATEIQIALVTGTINIQELIGLDENANLDNLQKLTLRIPLHIDLPAMPSLVTFDAKWSKLESLDLSNSPKLETIGVSFSTISDLKVHGSAPLRTVNMLSTPTTNIDLPSSLLNLNAGKVTSLDLSKWPNLQSLGIMENNVLTSLDVSNNTSLSSLVIVDCPNITEVFVWDGFDTKNPGSHFNLTSNEGTTPSTIQYTVKQHNP